MRIPRRRSIRLPSSRRHSIGIGARLKISTAAPSALNPSYARAHHWLGSDLLAVLGRMDEAEAEVRIAIELDPLSLIVHEGARIHSDAAARIMKPLWNHTAG